ncbi:MAG: LamB/YcsF family protein [Actinobacteria bacterium]|nr:LamB/YcsF family protein [Actinomycetota bacterium]MCB8996607.1 LamB/YcsF family protein [Actinomycetota bacterium]MCB9415050.1 LamB/YcsF family protein [Actinomycetota bacterium]HRY10180.1 5-oxoprolinase subunit PxpA [Candidatus Nanopelagicales bacterium]
MSGIDLNADVGEMHPDLDARIVEVVTSVNIACGGHAGDEASMRRVATLAAKRQVRIGAHPSYVDPDGFGRVRQEIPTHVLTEQIIAQIERLAKVSPEGVDYVKPHGALYHTAATESAVAEAVVSAVGRAAQRVGSPLALMGQAGALYLAAAEGAGIPTILEGFADRAYQADGRLLPRGEPGAVLTDEQEVVQQVAALARGEVRTIDGQLITLRAESVCVHSDTPGSATLARRIRDHLEASGIPVRAQPWN